MLIIIAKFYKKMEENDIESVNIRLKQLAKAVFGSLKEMDLALNRKQGYLSNYINQKSMLGGETLQFLADKYDININWLLTGKGSMLISDKENAEVISTKPEMTGVPYLTMEALEQLQRDLTIIKEKIGVYEK